MNIKIFSIHNLLKLILIFNISLAIVNSVSAQEPATPQGQQETEQQKGSSQATSNEDPDQRNDDNSESEDSQSEPNDDNSIESSTPPSESKNTEQSTQSEDLTNSQKTLTIKDILLFIDLPILATLLLLWFLTQNKQQKQIKELTKNQDKIISKFNQFSELDNKLSNLDRTSRQIIEKIQDSNQKNIDLEVRLRKFLSNQHVNKPINYHSNIGLHSNNDSNVQNLDISPPEPLHYQPDKFKFNSVTVVDNIPQFVEMYNRNKYFLSDEVIATVGETQESLNQRHSGDSNTVTFQNSTKKKYWIIEENNVYYLIPHAKIKIDEYNIKNLESLFECISFHSEYSDFQLVEPAIVFNNDNETWQLERKGKIKFI